MRSRRTILLGMVLWACLGSAAHAAPTPAALGEIEYLLTFVGGSGCEFFRNGTWYDSRKAEAHLRYKYEVLVAHDQIGTADDFIERAATKSSLSGRAYKVRCAGSPDLTSARWLRDALARYRLNGWHDATGSPRAP